LNINPPTTDRGSVASSSFVNISFIESGTGEFGVIYATAEASGKSKSAVQSISY
jgi:hypothetical protein